MPLVYTKEEIKEYLANRGFDVKDDDVVKRFIRDLKKLVKSEDRQRRRVNLGHDPQETNLESPALSPSAQRQGHTSNGLGSMSSGPAGRVNSAAPSGRGTDPKEKNQGTDPFGRGTVPSGRGTHPKEKNQGTDPSGPGRGTVLSGRGTVPSGRRTDPKEKNQGTDPSGRGTDPKKKNQGTGKQDQDKENRDETSEILYLLGDILGEQDVDEKSSGGDSGDGRNQRKTGPSDAVKRDPVALYYYYKKFWDKQNFPGDNRHMKLRWNVRAQTVGNYPCIDGHAVKYLR